MMDDSKVIDFVIPWVDGADPVWAAKKAKYAGPKRDGGNDAARFRDWEILKYWFRAVEEYAPWVHCVYFVTDDQKPAWLNTQHPKLCWVKHTDFIPTEYLPTFSSHTIELNFNRIPGLSEYFVYFNDDMFLNAPVTPDDFFQNGYPCDRAILGSFVPKYAGDAYTHAQLNVIAVINKYFQKHEVMRRNPALWFNVKYGKNILKNIYYGLPNGFSYFYNAHVAVSMLKSTYEIVWNLEPELLHNTCKNRFRSLQDVNQYIMSYYNLCSGKFVPRSSRFGKCYGIERDNKELYDDIVHGKHKVICINDHPEITDFEREKSHLIALFERKFPKKSSFEL